MPAEGAKRAQEIWRSRLTGWAGMATVVHMTYIKRTAVTTSVQHRFESDIYGRGVDVCSGCGRYREDRDHARTAPTYAEAVVLHAR